jgi:hypothetical protein
MLLVMIVKTCTPLQQEQWIYTYMQTGIKGFGIGLSGDPERHRVLLFLL